MADSGATWTVSPLQCWCVRQKDKKRQESTYCLLNTHITAWSANDRKKKGDHRLLYCGWNIIVTGWYSTLKSQNCLHLGREATNKETDAGTGKEGWKMASLLQTQNTCRMKAGVAVRKMTIWSRLAFHVVNLIPGTFQQAFIWNISKRQTFIFNLRTFYIFVKVVKMFYPRVDWYSRPVFL